MGVTLTVLQGLGEDEGPCLARAQHVGAQETGAGMSFHLCVRVSISLVHVLPFPFSMIVYIQCYFVLISGVQRSVQTIVYFAKCFPQYFQSPPGTIHGYSNIIDSTPRAVLDIPAMIL